MSLRSKQCFYERANLRPFAITFVNPKIREIIESPSQARNTAGGPWGFCEQKARFVPVSDTCDRMLPHQSFAPVQQSVPFARLHIHKLQRSWLKFFRLMV